MRGLVLEGGGVKGSYQAGVYMAMYEYGLNFDGVVGTSIGAINAAVIASGKGHHLADIWRKLDLGNIFGFSPTFVKAVNNKKFDLNFLYQLFIASYNVLSNKGIPLKGLKEVITKYVDIDYILKNKMDFGLCTVRLNDFQPLYLFKEDMGSKIKDYLLASSLLPIFKREKLIDDKYYIDGGFYDNGPVNMLLNKGYDEIYLVKLNGPGFYQKYDSSKVTIIESKRSLGRVIGFDPLKVEENIKMGYYDALRVIRHLDGEKYAFKVKNEKYYRYLNRHVSKNLYRRVSNFFNTKTYKDTTIKALEYVMERVNINYYQIYKPYKVLKYLQKNYIRNHFIFNYLHKLKHFI